MYAALMIPLKRRWLVSKLMNNYSTYSVKSWEWLFFWSLLLNNHLVIINRNLRYERLINHVDVFDYISLLNWLDKINITKPYVIIRKIKSGFHSYMSVNFKNDAVKQM
ncbi:hypothetical protein ASS94_14635 [Staphylococcus equorum]|uniref:Uncharacterized protein n=1 Tax=Staphylococcus equorum TaxID=246432 RepID=A0AAP7IAV7_9STAP|nr:hypothetical protein ASS94_14635 [Staphylococcus equorum]